MSVGRLVLCYHAVSDRWPCELAIPPARLRSQLQMLLDRGYRAVRFSELTAAPPGARLLAVTFDDGFRSTVSAGLPVLRELGIPASMFVSSAFVGMEALDWPGVERWLGGPYGDELAPVSWDSLRELADAGWEIGSHTRTHPHLTEISDEQLREELQRSREELEAGLGRRCASLAYPFGAVDRRVLAATRAAGYRAAATLPIRLDETTALTWPRVGIYRTDGPLRFRFKVSDLGRAARRSFLAWPMVGAQRCALALADREERAARRPPGPRPARSRARGPDRDQAPGPQQTHSRPGGPQQTHSRPGGPQQTHERAAAAAQDAVLLTDADERSIVAATRALGLSGYAVAATASEPHAAAQCSRFCRQAVLLADPLRDVSTYVQGLERTLSSGRYAIFIPGSDPALLIASTYRARLERHALIGLPPHALVLQSLDKLALAELARGTGLDVPQTALCENVEHALRLARELGYPIAIKPRSSAFEREGRLRHVPGRVVADETELAHVAGAYGERFLLQRHESGELLAYGGVIAGGRLRATAAARCLRTHRPGSGSLAFGESISPAPLRESVAALMLNAGHEGMFELDLVRRPDGSIALLDLNPRPYGAMALATASGANLPRIWCDWLLGRDPEPAEGRPGVRFRWEDADLFHMACRLREGRPAAAAAVLRPHRHVTHAYFCARDPGPAAARALWLARDFARHGFGDRRELGLRAA